MNKKLYELSQRHGELLAKIAVQREQMTEIEAEWNTPLALADQGVEAVRFLRRHPLLVAVVTTIFVVRGHRFSGLLWTVLRVLKGYRKFTTIPVTSLLRD